MSDERKTVLLVDDDLTNLMVGKKTLSGKYKVFTVNSGAVMLEMLVNITPDLILLDVNMPEMTGHEALQKLKENEKTADIPVIFLTAMSDSDSMQAGYYFGADDYIAKPFEPQDLLDRIEQALAKPKKPAVKTVAAAVPKALANLFPEGHKGYTLAVTAEQKDLLYAKNFDCPLCDKPFSEYTLRTTKLKTKEREKDFRVRNEGIDSIHYEIITCPNCCFSMFETAYKTSIIHRFKQNMDKLIVYKKHINLQMGIDRDIKDIFTAYYLALKCTELFYANGDMNAAKVWMRLMWLYSDCGNKEMEMFAARKAHSHYLSAFENTDMGQDAIQQLSVLIGELSLKVNDLSNAKTFFLKARTYKQGSQTLISQAEDGIEAVKKLELKKPGH